MGDRSEEGGSLNLGTISIEMKQVGSCFGAGHIFADKDKEMAKICCARHFSSSKDLQIIFGHKQRRIFAYTRLMRN